MWGGESAEVADSQIGSLLQHLESPLPSLFALRRRRHLPPKCPRGEIDGSRPRGQLSGTLKTVWRPGKWVILAKSHVLLHSNKGQERTKETMVVRKARKNRKEFYRGLSTQGSERGKEVSP